MSQFPHESELPSVPVLWGHDASGARVRWYGRPAPHQIDQRDTDPHGAELEGMLTSPGPGRGTDDKGASVPNGAGAQFNGLLPAGNEARPGLSDAKATHPCHAYKHRIAGQPVKEETAEKWLENGTQPFRAVDIVGHLS